MKVSIKELTFKCIIGILPFERKNTQRVKIDISFEYTYENDKKDFVDYSKVAADTKDTMKKKRFELIEEAIIYLKKRLEKKYPLKNLTVKITKPDILKDCIVSVEG